jgi:hypothetical protein
MVGPYALRPKTHADQPGARATADGGPIALTRPGLLNDNLLSLRWFVVQFPADWVPVGV